MRPVRLLDKARYLRRLVVLERACAGPPRPDLWREGFLSHRAALFPFDRHPRALFVTDHEVERRLPALNDPADVAVLGDKVRFHDALAAADGTIARTEAVAVVEDGRVRWIGDGAAAAGPFVEKPASGSKGAGVRRIERIGEATRDGVVLVERLARQHRYAEAIFPDALNTLRVMTARDPADGAPFVFAAVHRFATAATAPVDSFSRGGVSAPVDLRTGLMGAGRSLPRHGRRQDHPRHPDTGAAIAGVRVPGHDAVLHLALSLAALFPGILVAGWDIAVTPDGPIVVEGNGHTPNLNLVQAHGPLLADPRTRAFFVENGVLTAGHLRRLRRLEAGRPPPRPGERSQSIG